jgi:recombination protein RecT
MAESKKTEIAEKGKAQASLVVNNAFIDGLSAQLAEKAKYGLSFPKDYNPTNALTGAYLIMKETADKNGKCILESCSQTSIANSLMDMVTLGLNATKKQGYFIAYGGKCQFQKSYFGNIALARRCGLKTINAEVIYKGDKFEYHKEDAVTVIDKHEQSFENIDNDNIIGAYAVATMEDGTKMCEIMTLAQLKKAWAQRMGGLKEDANSTHTKFREEMSKKTVCNRLCKKITNTYGDSMLASVSDEVDTSMENVDIIQEDVAHDVDQNMATEEFVPQDEPQAVETPVERVEAEEVEVEIPDFLKGE